MAQDDYRKKFWVFLKTMKEEGTQTFKDFELPSRDFQMRS